MIKVKDFPVILPEPKEFFWQEGALFIDPDTPIVLIRKESSSFLSILQDLQQYLARELGFKLPILSRFTYETGIILQINEGLREEEYTIKVTNQNAVLTGGSEKGLRYAAYTLVQLIMNYGRRIPGLLIKDYPYFQHRGFYHDVTRGKVPTLKMLKEIVDQISFYKYNQLQLYVEHSFLFDHFTELWADADPLTAEEILILDEYCQKKGVELVPSISTFGHLYTPLRSQSFKALSELENPDKMPFGLIERMLHHTLDVTNPKSIEFVETMLDQYMPLFSSPYFNICADETFDLGKGKSKARADEVGVGKLYVEFLNNIIAAVETRGKKVMVWGDIISKHPEYLHLIEGDVTFLNWDYKAEPTEERIQLFESSNRPFYQCSGTWGWNHLIANVDLSYNNIRHTGQLAKRYNALGMLNTDWGDCGHLNPLSSSTLGLIYGAIYSWNPEQDDHLDEINEKISFIHYRDQHRVIADWITTVSKNTYVTHGHVVRFIETGAHYQFNEEVTDEEVVKANANIATIREHLLDSLAVAKPNRNQDIHELIIMTEGTILLNELLLVIRRYVMNEEIHSINPEQLAIKIEQWLYLYMFMWRKRNKESELFRIKDIYQKLTTQLRKRFKE